MRREFLLEQSGRHGDPFDRSIDVQVSRLRRKLSKAGITLNIESVRSVGYMLVGQVNRC